MNIKEGFCFIELGVFGLRLLASNSLMEAGPQDVMNQISINHSLLPLSLTSHRGRILIPEHRLKPSYNPIFSRSQTSFSPINLQFHYEA